MSKLFNIVEYGANRIMDWVGVLIPYFMVLIIFVITLNGYYTFNKLPIPRSIGAELASSLPDPLTVNNTQNLEDLTSVKFELAEIKRLMGADPQVALTIQKFEIKLSSLEEDVDFMKSQNNWLIGINFMMVLGVLGAIGISFRNKKNNINRSIT